MVNRRSSGFTLLEVMVSVLLVTLVLILLARGMDLVSETVTRGQRRIDIHRQLETARRVFRADVAAIADPERWPVFFGGTDQTDAPVLAFLRYRNDSAGDTETEWVQYWLEAHPDEDRLVQWVRYAGPADAVARSSGPPQEQILEESEVVLDHLVEADLQLWTDAGQVSAGDFSERPRAIDVRWAATAPPFPVVDDPPPSSFLQRVEQENAEWIEFRCRPGVAP